MQSVYLQSYGSLQVVVHFHLVLSFSFHMIQDTDPTFAIPIIIILMLQETQVEHQLPLI